MRKKNQQMGAMVIAALFLLCCGRLSATEAGPLAAAVPDAAHLSIGSGYGLSYGGIGLGCEFNPQLPKRFGTGFHRYTSLVLGLGIMPDGGLAYSFGIHAYPLGRGHFLQPRLSVQYGVVALADEYFSGDERRAEGVALGTGFLLRLVRRVFLDVDTHFIVPVEYAMEEIEGGRIRFSAGVRYRL